MPLTTPCSIRICRALDISTTPEFAQGYEWASDRIAARQIGEQDIFAYAPDEARRRFKNNPRLGQDWLFVGGVLQALGDHGSSWAARAAEA